MSRLIRLVGDVYYSMSLRTKLIISYLLLIVLPVGLLVYFSYMNIHKTVLQQSGLAYLEAIKQAEKNIGYGTETAKAIGDQAQNSYDIQRILKTVSQRELTLSEEIDFFMLLNKNILNYEMIDNIVTVHYFMNGNARFVSSNPNIRNIELLALEPSLRPMLSGNVHEGWFGASDFTQMSFARSDELIYVREIRDLGTLSKTLGYLMLEINSRFVWNIIRDIRLPEGSVIAVTSSNGQLIESEYTANLDKGLFEAVQTEVAGEPSKGIARIKRGLMDYYVVYSAIPSLGWTVHLIMGEEQLGANSAWMTRFLFGLAAVICLLAMTSALIISGTITKRLKRLVRLIRHAEKGSLKTEDNVRGNDEYAQLQRAFNRMSVEIKQLIEEVYQAKISKQDTEMKLLYAQIHPHFLYNTLDIIHWSALRIDAKDIAEVTQSLAKFLRHSLNGGKDHIRLSEELDGVERYMYIINFRYKGSIRLTMEVEAETDEEVMPKMILQPLVENAVVHGIRPKPQRSGDIVIRAWREGDDLLLQVADDGAGMDSERLATVLERYSEGYGVKNVHQRIQAYYGEDCGLSFESAPGQGCRVTARLKPGRIKEH
ncbi:sensor histidine kinase [Paenibacillus sp. HWE-109]|uniref:cache domain-containing sensor histidine kinase n=1 Tax=Paenibacillus sp. HWE-109 TaxID=1306526 RepID=UPI001EDC93B4|nr:sensor histidine kinase [Paenibacillus sp. HWE-109]UKS29601.1 sensor histidine kinase [Paenibacillus sp. HWE-109]